MERQAKCPGSSGAVAEAGRGGAGAGTGPGAVKALRTTQARTGEYFLKTLR